MPLTLYITTRVPLCVPPTLADHFRRTPHTNESIVINIMIFGGSDSGGDGLDKSVSIQPEDGLLSSLLSAWNLKSCMVVLPDGTFMIMNGAQRDMAGFDDADHPNLSAHLYDPEQPVGARISILNTTTIVWLYHSEELSFPTTACSSQAQTRAR